MMRNRPYPPMAVISEIISEITISHIIGKNTSVRPQLHKTAVMAEQTMTMTSSGMCHACLTLARVSVQRELSVCMVMYVPDDVLCAATEKANKAKEGERDVPILDDGRAHDGMLYVAHRA